VKRLLNTLYVTTQEAYLCHEGESVLVKVGAETKLRLPIHNLSSIVGFGQVTFSAPLMGLCAERGVSMVHLTRNGRFLARVHGKISGNVLLRREQYRRADDPAGASELARMFLLGKVANCRGVLQRAARDHGAAILEPVVGRLAHRLRGIKQPVPLATLRGFEGDAAGDYFDVFDNLITAQKEDFKFTVRSRRPPLDEVNALLSFLYTLLAHDIVGALEGVGLDPQVGFLHADRPGRPSLALDLMEEFRPWLADRMALSLINLKQVQAKEFVRTASGAVEMTEEARKTVLTAWQKRKQEELEHPYLGEKFEVGLFFHAQALLLARFLRGDMDGYPPFIWR
jgi:CRISPR-associated protein Cas1